jgi:hypothetical protein
MTIAVAVNRIVNIILLLICSACIFTLALQYFSRTSGLGSHEQNYVKKDTQPHDFVAVAIKEDINKAYSDTSIEIMRDLSKPWYIDALRNNPLFRKSQIIAHANEAEIYYADLYKMLDLDDAASEKMRELLGERALANEEVSADELAMNDVSLEDYRSGKETAWMEYNAKIAELLGDEKAVQFSEYENTILERNKIKQYREALAFSDEPLSLSQEKAMLPILEQFFEDNKWAQMNKRMATFHPTTTPLLFEDEFMVLKEVLSAGQLQSMAELLKRQSNVTSVNYPFRSIGKRLRSAR